MLYRYETHCHCANCSACASAAPGELVRAFYNAGYAGMTLTDHFVLGNSAVDRSLPWEEKVRRYYNAYLEAKQASEGLDFDVFFGIEHACEYKEVLCFGLEPEFLLSNPDIPDISLREFSARAHAAGGLIIQAHPLRARRGMTHIGPLPLDTVDGYELYNAHNEIFENHNALEHFRTVPGVIATTGGDIHHANDFLIGSTGVLLSRRVRTAAEFVAELKAQRHRVLVRGRALAPEEVLPEHMEKSTL